MKAYQIFAGFIFWFHWAWIFLFLAGIILSLKYKKYRPYQAAVIIITLTSQLIYLRCPLSVLENKLRGKYDLELVYSGSFISHYLGKYLNIQISDSSLNLITATIVFISALIILKTK